MFYGANFIFNSIASENYGLQILDFQQTSGATSSSSGNSTEINQKWIYRRTSPFHFGNTQNIPLEFSMTVGYENFVSAIDRSNVLKWLLGKSGYQKLIICQDDLQGTYFNVIFTSAETIFVGNKQVGLKLNATCDAPWGHTEDQSFNYDFTPDAVQSFDFTFFNSSDNNNYLYPTIEFTLNSLGSDFTLTNTTDDSRQFIFTGLSANEGITVNNSLQIIESTTGLYRLSYFNKNWFRFLPGLNSLHITSAISLVEFTYSFARAVGG